MSRMEDQDPFLTGSRVWLLVAAAVAVALVALLAVVWSDQRSLDEECERLDQRVVTNQEEADDLFDDKSAAGCLGRD